MSSQVRRPARGSFRHGSLRRTSLVPVALEPPSIDNLSPHVGDTLTASTGAWTNVPTSYSYLWSNGTTGPSYSVQSSDVGQTFSVTVTASNAFGASLPATSASTNSVWPLASANTMAPNLTSSADLGYPSPGDVLQCDLGSWDGVVDTFTFTWYRDDSSVVQGPSTYDSSGTPSSESYTVMNGDLGHTLYCVVTANNASGSTSAASTSSGGVAVPVPINLSPPSIDNLTPHVGDILTADAGSWAHAPTSIEYHWSTGATGNPYTVQLGDLGQSISVTVIGSNAAGTAGPVTSGATAVVLPAPPSNTVAPGLTSDQDVGNPTPGSSLFCDLGTWSGQIDTFTRTWMWDDGTVLLSSTYGEMAAPPLEGYVIVSADVGHQIHCIVSAANAGGSISADTGFSGTASYPSAPVSVTPPALDNLSPHVGEGVTCTNGSWSNYPDTFSYQWYDQTGSGPAAISGANAASYVVQLSDVGSSLFVRVTASNGGGSGDPATSESTGLIAAPPELSSAPNLSSNADLSAPIVGDVLTCDTGAWYGTVETYTFTWQRDDSTVVQGPNTYGSATSELYTIKADDIGHSLHVLLTASGPGGGASVSSNSSGSVSS